jgi:hypothetical protein
MMVFLERERGSEEIQLGVGKLSDYLLPKTHRPPLNHLPINFKIENRNKNKFQILSRTVISEPDFSVGNRPDQKSKFVLVKTTLFGT